MIKSLTKHGNSWALVIDKPILELLNIDPEQPLEITTDGKTLVVSPAPQSNHQQKVRAARAKINQRHSAAFKKLAE